MKVKEEVFTNCRLPFHYYLQRKDWDDSFPPMEPRKCLDWEWLLQSQQVFKPSLRAQNCFSVRTMRWSAALKLCKAEGTVRASERATQTHSYRKPASRGSSGSLGFLEDL